METLVKVNADELNQTFLDFIRANFKGKKISLHIYEDDIDETEYLLTDKTHKDKLLKTIQEVDLTESLKVYTMDEIRSIFLNEPKD
jgi:thymidylate synthase